MSEYRSVNFSDLCRLCAATQGNKLNVFSDSGRKQQLAGKIAECLPLRVEETDELPKSICELCVQQIHQIHEYRLKCSNTQTMLKGCLGTTKLKNEGRVYIKDESARAGPGGSRPATNIVTLKNINKPTLVPLASQPQVQQVVQQQQQTQQLDPNTMTISAGNDYLQNIVQSVGIKMEDGTDQPQYTFTIKEMPQQQQQTLNNEQQRLQTYSQMDEFLKPKTEGKPQYNLVLNQNNQLQQITTTSTASSSPQIKQVLQSNNQPFVLTTNAGGMRTVTTQAQQQQQVQVQQQQTQQKTIQMVQTQPKQCIIMKDNQQHVYQLKLEPQMSTADGQTIYQLTQAPTGPTFQTITPTQQQQAQEPSVRNEIMMPRTQAGKMGSGVTPIQFTTLTNVASNSNKGSPTMITFQDTPGKGQTATQITPVGRIASTTITRKTPLVLKQETGTGGQVKYVTSQAIPHVTGSVQSSPVFVQSSNMATTSNGGKVMKSPRTLVKTMKVISASPGHVKTVSMQAQPKVQQTVQTMLVTTGDEEEPMTIEVEMDPSGKGKPTCDVCQKEFKRKEHLAQHMKLHQGVRPFKCDQCDKAFNRKEHLLRHRTSHTGAKSFKCEHCQKMFSRKDNLNKHKRKHTGGEDADGDKSFKSDDMGEEEMVE